MADLRYGGPSQWRPQTDQTVHAIQPHTPPTDRMYVTDARRQAASSLNAPLGGGITNKYDKTIILTIGLAHYVTAETQASTSATLDNKLINNFIKI